MDTPPLDMKTPTAETQFFEFRFPHLDTMLRLEVNNENATIYASRDSFSQLRKEMFIRELNAEGFIPETVLGYFGSDPEVPCSGVRWIVDHGWRARDEVSEASAQRFVRNIFMSSFLLIAVFFGLVFGGSYYSTGSQPALGQTAAVHGSKMARR
jgi:hypothetical protein